MKIIAANGVLIEEHAAVGFYRAVGLQLLAETTVPKPADFGVPPEYRMGMRLGTHS